MAKYIIVISIFLSNHFIGSAQYSPNFSVINKGIARPASISEEYSGSDPTAAPTYNVSGMNWTLTGTLADPLVIATSPAVAERTYALTIAGNKFRTLRPNGDLCVTSPVLNIASAGAVSINLSVTRTGIGTYISTNDRVFFQYVLDGSTFATTGPLTGASGSIAAWNPTGITGNTLQVYACMSANGFTEEYDLTTFTVSGGVVLPITLSSFFANLTKENEVKVVWQTATEKNNAYFDIERSEDGKNFKSIGQERGKGNTNSGFNYAFLDKNPNDNTNYYRLKQNDSDGHFEYSNILSVNNIPKQGHFVFSPNPVSDVLNVEYIGKNNDTRSFEIYDVLGKLVYQISNDLQENEINTSHLERGTYFLRIHQDGKIQTSKFLKI